MITFILYECIFYSNILIIQVYSYSLLTIIYQSLGCNTLLNKIEKGINKNKYQ